MDPIVVALRRRRLALGLSVRGLAIHAGLSPRTIGQLECGETHGNLTTIRLLAAAMDMTLTITPPWEPDGPAHAQVIRERRKILNDAMRGA